MNLLSKINKYFIINSILLFVFIYLILFFIIDRSIRKEADQQLKNISKKVVNELKQGGAVDYPPFIVINKADTIPNRIPFYEDVYIKFYDTEEDEPFRQLTTYANIKGQEYEIIARTSMREKNELFLDIALVIFIGILLLLFTFYIINKRVSRYVLSDIYDTINKIEQFSISDPKNLNLKKSDIIEFEKLNNALSFLAEKAKKEYRILREFTEELNHEIQTPISVIKSKIELLLQSIELTADNYYFLEAILKNLNKLEKINKSILLLNKLENTDIFEVSEVDMNIEINNVIKNFQSFGQFRNLSIEFINDSPSNSNIEINQSLFGILISNLISNAIKYSYENSSIKINLARKEKYLVLTISNYCDKPKSLDKFFDRFYKESDSYESIGLGLAIVKKICNIYKIEIKNYYENNLYTVELTFISKNS